MLFRSGKVAQTRIAYRSKMNYQGKKPVYHLYDFFDNELREDYLYLSNLIHNCVDLTFILYPFKKERQ